MKQTGMQDRPSTKLKLARGIPLPERVLKLGQGRNQATDAVLSGERGSRVKSGPHPRGDHQARRRF